MDKRIQQYRYLAIVLTLLTTTLYGQCDKKRIEVITDTIGCRYVVMSPEKFTFYHQSEKNLKIIKDSIPKIVKEIKKINDAKEEIKDNLEQKVKLESMKKEMFEKDSKVCYDKLAEQEVENDNLRYKLGKERKRTIVSFGLFVICFTLLIITK